MRRVWNVRLAIAGQDVSRRRAANYFCRPPFACSRTQQEPNNCCLFKLRTCGPVLIGEIE
jgi:hypothetical protein